MKKRIISIVLSAVISLSAVSAMSANAFIHVTTKDTEKLDELHSDWLKVEDSEWLSRGKHMVYEFEDVICMYAKEEKGILNVKEYVSLKDSLSFIYDDAEAAKNIVAAIDESLKLNSTELSDGSWSCSISANEITPQTARKLRDSLGNSVKNYVYNFNRMTFLEGYVYHPTGYTRQFAGDDYEAIKEKITDYVKSADIKTETIEYSIGDIDENGNKVRYEQIRVIPSKEYTIEEYMALGKDIYEKTGLQPVSDYPETSLTINGTTLDLTDYLNGDANCDSVATMADAAAILQAIGNPDKYSLSDLGAFNADFANDGLTPDDAIAIQKKLAGIAE